MLFPLPSLLVSVLHHFGFFMVAERMQVDPALAVLLFYRTLEIDWFLSKSPDDFFAFDFPIGNMSDYLAGSLPPVKWQKTDDDPILPVPAPAGDIQCLPGTTCKTNFKVQGDYKG